MPGGDVEENPEQPDEQQQRQRHGGIAADAGLMYDFQPATRSDPAGGMPSYGSNHQHGAGGSKLNPTSRQSKEKRQNNNNVQALDYEYGYADALASELAFDDGDEPTTAVERIRYAAEDLYYGCSGCIVASCDTVSRRKGHLVMVAVAATAAIVIGFAATHAGSSTASYDGGNGGGLTAPWQGEGGPDLRRRDQIRGIIVSSGVSDRSALDREGTGQYQALHWLADYDEARLDAADPALVQRYALAVLFFTTYVTAEMEDREKIPSVRDPNVEAGRPWHDSHNWMTHVGYCSWAGIRCSDQEGGGDASLATGSVYDGNGAVTHLNLTANNVRGYLPRELMAFESLRVLDVGLNGLTGTIPPQIGTLTQLRTLYLGDNVLSGTIPAALGQLARCTHLYLDRNALVGQIPTELSALTSLSVVGLHENYLEGPVPDTAEWAQTLTALYLDGNQLTGKIPSRLGDLALLTDLRLSDNMLMGTIPTEIGKLGMLQELYLGRNQLSGTLPTELSNMRSLQEIMAYDNKLSGTIPELGELKDLRTLYLDHNGLTGFVPASLGQCNDLKQLYLQSNKLVGQIPESLGNLELLTHMFVENNMLQGEIPESLGNLEAAEKIRLHGNRFSGTVPDAICSLKGMNLVELQSDCYGDEPVVKCSCCTECF